MITAFVVLELVLDRRSCDHTIPPGFPTILLRHLIWVAFALLRSLIVNVQVSEVFWERIILNLFYHLLTVGPIAAPVKWCYSVGIKCLR